MQERPASESRRHRLRALESVPQVNTYRITPPERRLMLPRERLVSELTDKGLDAHLTVICADAGYGKTTLLCDFTHQTAAAVAWYRLERTDRDLTQFRNHVAEAIRRLEGSLGFAVRALAGRGAAALGPEDFAYLLVRDLDALAPRPVVLILDNYEKVNGNAKIRALLESLLGILPRHAHVFIATRERPDLPLARLRADQDLFELGPEELALNVVETMALARDVHGLALDNSQLKLLAEKTEGWTAGVVMAAQSLRYLPPAELIAGLDHLSGNSRAIYDYLAEEVFRRLDAATQSFLLNTSVLPRLPVEVVNEYLQTTSSRETLASLEDSGLFTHSAGEWRSTFRYHRLFREYLYERLLASATGEEIKSLHLRAARALENQRYFSEAREQYALAGDHEAAANLIERVAEDYLDRGMLETVGHWLSVTPESVVSTRPWLMALHGKALRRSNDHDAALQLEERAYNLFLQRGDTAGQVWTAYEISFIHYSRGRFAAGARRSEEMLARVGNDPIHRARTLAALCINSLGMDDLGRAAWAGEESARELAKTPLDWSSAAIAARAYRFLARTYAQQGRLDEAARTAGRAIEVCRSSRLSHFDTAWSYQVLGTLLASAGNWQGAREALSTAQELGGTLHKRLAEQIALWQGFVLRDTGDLAGAEDRFRRSGEEALVERAFLQVRMERPSEALRLAQEASRYYEHWESPGIHASVETVLATALLADGRAEAARRHLEHAVKSFEAHGLNQRLASALLHLAKLDFDEGGVARGLANLRAALDIARRLDLSHFLWWEPATFALLAGHALKHGIHTAQVLKILRDRLGHERAAQLLVLRNFPDVRVRDTINRLVEAIASEGASANTLPADLLAGCDDKALAERITGHVAGGLITVEELEELRARHGLTWREVDVYCVYYLETARGKSAGDVDRQACARRLCVSENTLKAHVKSIRRKLGLLRRGASVQRNLAGKGPAQPV